LRAGQFSRGVGGEQDGIRHASGKTFGLDPLRLSGNVPEPSLSNLIAADTLISRLMINDGISDQKLLDSR
jgi:hypothetical protein